MSLTCFLLFLQDDQITDVNSKGKLMYLQFDKVIQFNECMRQQGPEEEMFRNILFRLSNHQISTLDHGELFKRAYTNLEEDEKIQFDRTATKLCAKISSLKEYNIKRIQQLKTPIAVVKSSNNNELAAHAASNKAGNLPFQTIYSEGAKVMLTMNLWKSKGLVNGAQGTIVAIVYQPERSPPALPDVIFVQFDEYLGPSALPSLGEKIVPITPETFSWIQKKKSCSRTAMPLNPSYAITIHKSQGNISISLVFCDLNAKKYFIAALNYICIR